MEEVGLILKNAREKLELSIKQVSERTKIRPHIIRFLEESNFSVLPPVYGKSFLKTYINFLELDEDSFADVIKKLSVNNHSDYSTSIQPETPGYASTALEKLSNFKEIFKEQKSRKFQNVNIVNSLIYAAIIIFIFGMLYITFLSNGSDSDIAEEIEITSGQVALDTAIIEPEEKGLFAIFDKPDSLILLGKATDTAWLRIDIDGKAVSEVLMLPGMERRWAAKEYFLVNQGNVGAIQFTLADKLLEPFGSRGSVVKNVKITQNEVVTQSPWQKQTRKKAEKRKAPIMIEPSPIKPQNKDILKRNQ